MLADAGTHLGGNVFEAPIAEVFVDQTRILESLAGVVSLNLRVHVSIHLKKILPAIVVVVEEPAAPSDVLIVDADARGKRNIVEGAVPVVVVKVASVVQKNSF